MALGHLFLLSHLDPLSHLHRVHAGKSISAKVGHGGDEILLNSCSRLVALARRPVVDETNTQALAELGEL